jgi:ATP-dependent 26S proteasome regulatory subunit
LARANDITFITACASDFVEIYVGSGPKKVREIFELARKHEPSILFIDELEAIGVQRSSNFQSYTNNIERYSTLNQVTNKIKKLASI